jgi:molybdenum cofactor cytidylyltransferase
VRPAGIVLAAGLSRRMGQAKLLLPIGGEPVLRLAVRTVIESGAGPVIVVMGTERSALTAALAGLPFRAAVNDNPAEGQASSIRVGVSALPSETEAALIVLGDQPFLPREVIPALIAALAEPGKAIAAPRYRDGRGNPVLFARDIFPELLGIAGDQGARSVLERDPARVAFVNFDFPMPDDLDTPDDYDRLRSRSQTR